jgi:hypothetical protein
MAEWVLTIKIGYTDEIILFLNNNQFTSLWLRSERILIKYFTESIPRTLSM